jgi:hypothetical protein
VTAAETARRVRVVRNIEVVRTVGITEGEDS